MNDDFETKLRRLLNEDVDARLGARRAAPERAQPVSDRGRRNWMFPLIAAAAVAAVALGTFGASQVLADDGHTAPPATDHPGPTTSRTTSAPASEGHLVRLGRASISLPAGWVAHDERAYLSADQQPPGTWWCLTPAGTQVTPGSVESCPLNLGELPSELFRGGVAGNDHPVLDVDSQGGFYGDPPQRCIPQAEVLDGVQSADRTLGGRAADWRRWESHCTRPHRAVDIEQYVVATGPAYVLYSAHADATVHAAMTEIAASSTLPAQTTAARLMDRGFVRSATANGHGGVIVLDRAVRLRGQVTNTNPATYRYPVSASAWRAAQHQHLLTNGSLIVLWTDGATVRTIDPD